jgi:triphosphoribosyl-dephospho-CoA synthase
MEQSFNHFSYQVMKASQLAACLEVSATPKPGNVHRTADFRDTRYEHFLCGSIALGPSIREVSMKGIQVGLKEIQISEVGIGRFVKQCIQDVKESHKGGNTHLGISLLFIPLVAASGLTFIKNNRIRYDILRNNFSNLIRSTTVEDAIQVSEAIRLSGTPSLGKTRGVPDVLDETSKESIIKNNLNLHDLMNFSSKWDNIARELITDMHISFEVGYKKLLFYYKKTKDINIAVVQTFLEILSICPDTHIARKIGLKQTHDIEKAVQVGLHESEKISKKAKKILGLGGLLTEKGKEALFDFDQSLRINNNDLNPGSTADITACSILIAILCGLNF